MAKLSIVSEAEKLDMPDPEMAAADVDLMLRTVFDVTRDTRMEEFAADPLSAISGLRDLAEQASPSQPQQQAPTTKTQTQKETQT